MVSLNEKRSKVQYVVQNKTEWVDDENKFGKRMLEKMGWKSGVGLGKKEDGRTEHIDLKFKSNLKGVGFINNKYDSTWIAHSLSFDSLLTQLNQTHSSTPSDNNQSLNNFNEKIHNTKTRFNYKKQSSGKDLSSRSINELDAIFGWNKGNDLKQESNSNENTVNETESDLVYKTSKQSIDDYFKEKRKRKNIVKSEESETSINHLNESNEINDETIYENKSKKLKYSFQEKSLNDSNSKQEINTFEQSNKTNNSLSDFKNPYEGSNLLEINGYKGWIIDSSLENIIKKKQKLNKKRK